MNEQEARDLLAQAATEDATSQDSPQTEGTAQEGATLTNGNVDQIVQQIQENPAQAKELIVSMQRALGGQYGTELQKLRNEMAREKEDLLKRLEDNKPASTEPDEYGLTHDEYKRLGEVFMKTPQAQEQQAKLNQAEIQAKDVEARNYIIGLKQQYGQAITDDEVLSLYRLFKKSGYNYNDADVQDEYQAMLRRVESRKIKTPVEQEQETRQSLQSRVDATMDTPSVDTVVPSSTLDAFAKELKQGRLTDAKLVDIGKRVMASMNRTR